MRRIGLPKALKADFQGLAAAAQPAEALAVCLGQARGRDFEIGAWFPAANRAESPQESFRLDPLDWRAARLRAQELGLDLIGTVHSHPAGSAEPSTADRLGLQRLFPEAESWPYFICSAAGAGNWNWTCWTIIDAKLYPVTIYEV